jgi:glucose-1-phosphate thymidylyltransferase
MSAGRAHAGATVFVKQVSQPERYGVMAFDDAGTPRDIVEKPSAPSSPFAVTGLYFYDNAAVAIARDLQPSARGEVEITDINNRFLQDDRLRAVRVPDDVSWLDMGTPQGLLDASVLVAEEQRKDGIRIGVPEQVALRSGWIDSEDVMRIAASYGANDYGRYLRQLAESA